MEFPRSPRWGMSALSRKTRARRSLRGRSRGPAPKRFVRRAHKTSSRRNEHGRPRSLTRDPAPPGAVFSAGGRVRACRRRRGTRDRAEDPPASPRTRARAATRARAERGVWSHVLRTREARAHDGRSTTRCEDHETQVAPAPRAHGVGLHRRDSRDAVRGCAGGRRGDRTRLPRSADVQGKASPGLRARSATPARSVRPRRARVETPSVSPRGARGSGCGSAPRRAANPPPRSCRPGPRRRCG